MRRRLTAAGPRRPHLCGLRFFDLRRAGTPAAPKPVPATLVRHYPPPHTDSRLPDDTSVQHSLAPRPPLRRPNQPPTHTSCRASPRPPPRQTQKSGSRHRNRHPTSASSPAPGKSSGARPHTSASSPTCTSLRLPAHAPHPSSPSRHPATPEKTSPRIPPAASPRLPAPPSASPPRQAQKKRQPAKGCRASFKPPGD